MKPTHLLPLAALAAASAIRPPQQVIGDDGSMWDSVPSVLRPIEQVVDTVAHSIDQALEIIARAGHNVVSAMDDWYPGQDRDRRDRDRDDDKWRHRSDRPTVYELIRDSRNARKFGKLLEEHKDIRKKLDDKNTEYTVFVPTDEAFEKLPGHKEPDREFLEKLVEYHVIKGEYTVGRIMAAHTIPTYLDEKSLNNLPQRLRVSVSLFGVYLNFYCRIIASNIMGRNGIVHAVDNVLVPPPRQGRLIESLPAKFSTFALAMEKTELGDDLHKQPQRGGTVFAPTNNAWMKLGPEVNEFLFSRRGERYLRALLKYHVVLNETLYSDAYYEEDDRPRDHEDPDDRKDRNHRSHWEDEKGYSHHHGRNRHGDKKHHRDRHPYDDEDEMAEATDEDFLHHRRPRHGSSDEDDLYFAVLSSSHDSKHHNHKDDKHSHYSNDDERYLDRALNRDSSMWPSRHRHISLETCLRHRTLEVDIDRWMGLVTMEVNSGKARVSVQDGVARDGVVQVVESVLIPPMHGGRRGHDDDRDRDFEGPEGISVNELRDRLEKFVDEDDDNKNRRDRDKGWDRDREYDL